MKLRLTLLLCALALLLCGCGYLAVEDAPIQVGEAIHYVTPTPGPTVQAQQ